MTTNITQPQITHYVVQNGDTLYSISFRFGVTYQQLAAINDISPPYKLTIGQKIQIITTIQAHTKLSEQPHTNNKLLKNRDSSQKTPVVSIDNEKLLKLYCHWPINGEIVRSFSIGENNGIDIAGKLGGVVKAAASGKVVYSGDDIIGYGNLIIIQHDDDLLTAYANNERLLVTVGNLVEQDQPIAELGMTNQHPLLHFEIRRNGKPVNPVKYLPEK